MLIKIKKGLDLPIAGNPKNEVDLSTSINTIALLGPDYIGLKPTMLVKEGDTVLSGQKLFETTNFVSERIVSFEDKKNPGIFITAPSSGIIKSINRGEKRRLLSLIIELDNTLDSITFDSKNFSKSIDLLLESGTFSYFRTRPYNRIPEPNSIPAAIFVNACDTNPLSIDPYLIIQHEQELFDSGLKFIQSISPQSKSYCCYQNQSFNHIKAYFKVKP